MRAGHVIAYGSEMIRHRVVLACAGIAAVLWCTPVASASTPPDSSAPSSTPLHEGTVRIATFNASLNRAEEGALVADMSTPDDPQARNVAEVLQIVRPDLVLLNEFDYVDGGAAVELFQANYLGVGQHGHEPIEYPYSFLAPVNTGVESGLDLNNDGEVGGPDDAFGFGAFPGQYGMVILSMYPIETDQVRTFQNLPWPEKLGLPDNPDTPGSQDWFDPAELDVVRLSSKSHWDVPVDVDGDVIHVLASHPTPPVFDGPEDRNGIRNAVEIRFWVDYLSGDADGSWIVDDAGTAGPIAPDSQFVILGDLNSDPVDGDSIHEAIAELLALPELQDPEPTSEGAVVANDEQGGANADHEGDPALDTADFTDDAPGNLRSDYVLPSAGLTVLGSEVFWPTADEPGGELANGDPVPTSDHHLVWADVTVEPAR